MLSYLGEGFFLIFNMCATFRPHHDVISLLTSGKLPKFKFLHAGPRCGRIDPLVVTGQLAKRSGLVLCLSAQLS